LLVNGPNVRYFHQAWLENGLVPPIAPVAVSASVNATGQYLVNHRVVKEENDIVRGGITVKTLVDVIQSDFQVVDADPELVLHPSVLFYKPVQIRATNVTNVEVVGNGVAYGLDSVKIGNNYLIPGNPRGTESATISYQIEGTGESKSVVMRFRTLPPQIYTNVPSLLILPSDRYLDYPSDKGWPDIYYGLVSKDVVAGSFSELVLTNKILIDGQTNYIGIDVPLSSDLRLYYNSKFELNSGVLDPYRNLPTRPLQ
jgi:hypothetical protein